MKHIHDHESYTCIHMYSYLYCTCRKFMPGLLWLLSACFARPNGQMAFFFSHWKPRIRGSHWLLLQLLCPDVLMHHFQSPCCKASQGLGPKLTQNYFDNFSAQISRRKGLLGLHNGLQPASPFCPINNQSHIIPKCKLNQGYPGNLKINWPHRLSRANHWSLPPRTNDV